MIQTRQTQYGYGNSMQVNNMNIKNRDVIQNTASKLIGNIDDITKEMIKTATIIAITIP